MEPIIGDVLAVPVVEKVVAIVNDEDLDIIELPGDLPDILVVHRQSGLAIRVQDQVTVDDAILAGKMRLAICVDILQNFASGIPDAVLTPVN